MQLLIQTISGQLNESSLGVPLDPGRDPHVNAVPILLRPRGINAAFLTHLYLQIITDLWDERQIFTIETIDLYPDRRFASIAMIVSPEPQPLPGFTNEALAWGMLQAFEDILELGPEDDEYRSLNRYKIVPSDFPSLTLGSFKLTVIPRPANASISMALLNLFLTLG